MAEELRIPEDVNLYGCPDCSKVFFSLREDIMWSCPECGYSSDLHNLIIEKETKN